jgi:hypothetical protein
MDQSVIPLVNYFNSQGLKTKMSCEGHNKTNMSMFWISFDNSITEQDIINFQNKHLQNSVFVSCGRFAQRLYVGGPTIVKEWCYFAATKEAADKDLEWWQKDNEIY